jgi:hypothetical protein
MEETRLVITVACKVPLSDADVRFLQIDMATRLQATLVQKIASVEFKREQHGQATTNPQ